MRTHLDNFTLLDLSGFTPERRCPRGVITRKSELAEFVGEIGPQRKRLVFHHMCYFTVLPQQLIGRQIHTGLLYSRCGYLVVVRI